MHDQQRYRYLLEHHLVNRLSEEEEAELFKLLLQPEIQSLLEEDVLDQLREVVETGPELSDLAANRIKTRILNSNRQEHKRITWKAWAVAAAVLMMGTAVWLLLGKQDHNTPAVAVTKTNQQQDILPGGNKATLKLANGASIVLDSAANGILTQQGATQILKMADGQVTYTAHDSAGSSDSLLFNTIEVPRKGKYQLVLEDGTKVWMNAASSLRFPTIFRGTQRTVELQGEAYFEIAAKPKQPFHVKVNDLDLEVLGTSFNVMAYANENHTTTTLLSGAVRVSRGDQQTLLSPGQQLQVTPGGQNQLLKNMDTDQAVAWKENMFSFKSAAIPSIMRALARWYDVEVVYNNDVPELFYAQVSRNITLSNVLKALELTGKVKFRIEGNKVIVLPVN